MPEGPSLPVPVSAWPFMIVPGSALNVAELGAVLSMRIFAEPVLTASVLPTLSCEVLDRVGAVPPR